MTVENQYHSYGQPEDPADETIEFIHGFSGGNATLESLMKQYVLETRKYIPEDMIDEEDEVMDNLTANIVLTLVDDDRAAYLLGDKKHIEKDRFRKYVFKYKRVGIPEMDILFDDLNYLTTLGEPALDNKVAMLGQLWEANHPGRSFYPKSQTDLYVGK